MNLTENESNDITKLIGKKFLINEWRDTTLQKVSGIYKIINKLNGKYYVGSANVISRRWRDHIHKLKKDTHSNKRLQNAWNKYGENSFTFEIVEIISCEDLLQAEQRYLNIIREDWLNNRDTHYNVVYNSSSPMLGRKHTEYTKIRMSNRLLGHKLSDITKEKIRRSSLGKKISENTRIKISDKLRGKKRSPYPRKPHSKDRSNKIASSLKVFYSDPNNKKCGQINSNADNTKYCWINNKQNKMELATKWEMYTKYGIHPMYTRKLRSGKLKTIKGWTIKSA